MATISELLARCRERVNALRDERGEERITQQVLAKMVGVSPTAVRNWEAGDNTPGADHLRKIIKVYLQEGGFDPGKEKQQAKELWQEAGRKEAFDEEWFRGLPRSRRRQPTANEEYILDRMLKRNPRGKTLWDAIETVGLVDIENRMDHSVLTFPPKEFYLEANRQIVITGVSGFRTFDDELEVLEERLRAGRQLRVLILHPDAEDVQFLSKPDVEDRDIQSDILFVVNKSKKLAQTYQGFQIKFLHKMPPFTGVMLDGDIDCYPPVMPLDQDGQIRIQPRGAYKTQHKGIVLQFKKTAGYNENVFDYFAADMRMQWQNADTLKKVLSDMAR